jgi:hypothetical protein
LEILVPRICGGSKIAKKLKSQKILWNAFLVSNLLPIFTILTLYIHGISYDQSRPETTGLILVIGGRMGD